MGKRGRNNTFWTPYPTSIGRPTKAKAMKNDLASVTQYKCNCIASARNHARSVYSLAPWSDCNIDFSTPEVKWEASEAKNNETSWAQIVHLVRLFCYLMIRIFIIYLFCCPVACTFLVFLSFIFFLFCLLLFFCVDLLGICVHRLYTPLVGENILWYRYGKQVRT